MPELARRRIQIHLSTAIALMFVVGGIIGLNVHGKYQLGQRHVYGWPLHWVMLGPGSIYDYEPQYARLLSDIVVAFAILFATWFASEWIIRHRTVKKEP